MRTLVVLALAVLLAGTLLAQHSQFGNGTGFGNVIYPGTGRPPANPNVTGFGNVVFPGGAPKTVPNFSITDPTFANGLANTVSGRVPYGARHGAGSHGRRTSYVYVPYAYPVYTGGYDEYAQPQQPNVMVVNPAPQPPVVINQTFLSPQAGVAEAGPAPGAGPAMTIYQAPARSPEEMAAAGAEATQQYYLIAFKDHSIYSAIAYWTDGDTLHYFTAGNTHNQVSMSLVDKELTERLNKERNVDVRIAK